jgi:hypothetical protein
MLHWFDDVPSLASRALQIWHILVGMAFHRQTLTYGRLATIIGYNGAGVLDRQLGHIMYFCEQNELPPLTALVINEQSGVPGGGLILRGNAETERDRVFDDVSWYRLRPPSENELAEAWRNGAQVGEPGA